MDILIPRYATQKVILAKPYLSLILSYCILVPDACCAFNGLYYPYLGKHCTKFCKGYGCDEQLRVPYCTKVETKSERNGKKCDCIDGTYRDCFCKDGECSISDRETDSSPRSTSWLWITMGLMIGLLALALCLAVGIRVAVFHYRTQAATTAANAPRIFIPPKDSQGRDLYPKQITQTV